MRNLLITALAVVFFVPFVAIRFLFETFGKTGSLLNAAGHMAIDWSDNLSRRKS